MTKLLRGRFLAAVAVGALGLAAPAAYADTVAFTIGLGNTALSGYPGPYATVSVDRTSSTTAVLTYTGLSAGNYTYLFMDSGIADANVNATSWTIGSFTETNPSGFSTAVPTSTGSGTVDGFGVFNQTTKNVDGYAHAASEVGFMLTDTGGTWASAASVLTPNADGYSVAAHIAVCNTSLGACSPSIGASTTGYAVNIAPVPLPSGSILFGSALVGLGIFGFGLKRRRAM